jgi:hypothetical protein
MKAIAVLDAPVYLGIKPLMQHMEVDETVNNRGRTLRESQVAIVSRTLFILAYKEMWRVSALRIT